MYDLSIETQFAAAHQLRGYKGKCERMHGHNWAVSLTFTGPVSEQRGWVVDFAKIDDVWAGAVHSQCDHRLLNEIDGLDNPTSENLAVWVWQRFTVRVR